MNREKQEAILNKTEPAVRMEMQTFSEYLQKEGLKITNQRMLVAERIFPFTIILLQKGF